MIKPRGRPKAKPQNTIMHQESIVNVIANRPSKLSQIQTSRIEESNINSSDKSSNRDYGHTPVLSYTNLIKILKDKRIT